MKTTFYNYIPTENEVKDSFFSVAVKQLHDKLIESECVLTESGKWFEPSKVFRASDELRSLITNDNLKIFFDKEYISTAVENNADNKILELLGISNFSVDNLVECLKNTEWLANQTDEWFIELYSYLEKQSLGKQRLERIKKLKIIKLTNNELASPAEQKIFFPLNKRQNYGFEKRIPFINKKTLALDNKESAEGVEKFLKSIDVFKAQPYEIVENYILADYENDGDEGWKARGKELLLGYIRYIKDNLGEYKNESDKRLNSHKNQWQTKSDPLERLKKGTWIFYKEEKATNWYAKPDNLYLTKDYGNNNDLEFLSSGMENINFVHSLYLKSSIENIRLNSKKSKEGKKKTKEKIETETKEWNEFFTKLGVEIKPRITKTVIRRWSERSAYYRDVTKFSLEMICSILNENNKDKNSILLKILDTNWNYYNQFKVWQDRNHRGRDDWSFIDKTSDWFEALIRANWLLTTKGELQKPSTLFLDKPEIKDLLGESVRYLSAEIENQEFIKSLTINTTVDVETILGHLKRMVDDNYSDKENFIKFYSFLDSHFVSNEQLIKKTFADSELIFIPETIEKYVSSEKVLWKDVSKVFGDQRFYLEKHYDSLKKFFVEKLGVNEKPTPKDYADVLCEMTDKDLIDKNDEEKILNIYKELNNSLKSDGTETTITIEGWWNDFIQESIFWTNKLEFWQNHEDVFVNDDEELYKLFQDKPDVAFLKLPAGYHPKLQNFLKETGILNLSNVIKTQLPSAVETIFAEELTEKVRQLFPFIVRYLYFNVTDTYEKSKEDERLLKLKNLFCYGVDKLEVSCSLNEESATSQRSHYLDGNKLYVNLDFLENYNRIAIEISKIFGNPQGLNDFISVLFLQPDLKAIEEYLKDRNIQQLPESEKEAIEEIISIPEIEANSPEITEEIVDFIESDIESQTDNQPSDNSVNGQDKNVISDVEVNDDFEEEEYEEELDSSLIQTKSTRPEKVNEAKNTNGNGNQPSSAYESQEECSPEDAEVRVSALNLKNPGDFTFSTPEKEENLSDGTTSDSTNNGDTEPPSRESLSHAEKLDIGRWGEEYSLKHIKEKLLKKYPDGSISDASYGFNIIVNKKAVAQVYWLNKNSDVGKGYDIKIIENSGETFIEVKSTKTESKEIFQISGTQWRLAQLQQSNFYVYRVFSARTDRARLVEIRNPAEMFRTGQIIAQNITLKI